MNFMKYGINYFAHFGMLLLLFFFSITISVLINTWQAFHFAKNISTRKKAHELRIGELRKNFLQM